MFNNVQFWSFPRQTLLAVGVTAAYGLYVRRKAGLLAAVAALPDVAKIVTTPEISAKVDDPTVTAR